jgi:hypothetical protein
VPRETAGSRVLPAWLQNAVLLAKTGVGFEAGPGGSGADWRPEPSFISCTQRSGLGFA